MALILPRSLPRDARDTLFLLVVIAGVVFMQVGHIPWWCTALTAGVLLWRGTLAVRNQPLPGWLWRSTLLALTLGATYLTHGTLLGRDAGVTLIVVLLALKTLELRARRDAFVVFFLAFFALLTHFFYSQSLLTAVGILLALLGLLTALVNANMPVGRPSLWQAARTAAGMAALGAPIMLVLFLLFPRMAPLWSMPGDPIGRSGLSGEMRVGEMAELVLDERIAMRIRFEDEPPPRSAMYFRGPVLTDFDGLRWGPLRSGFPDDMRLQAELRLSGEPIRYEVTLEPHQQRWLFLLEAGASAPVLPRGSAQMTSDLRWLSPGPVTELLRYSAQSHVRFQHGPTAMVLGLQDHLELPPGYNPRTLAWAVQLGQQWGTGPQSARALIDAVLQHLRTGGYTYTLAPGIYGRDSADEFWFDRREGFCEHIASSFVILMRALDIPARIVTGYQGGELNPVDGFWTVRQSDAHAWAEVWLAGEGWVRIDPTGMVAPGRVDAFERLRPPDGLFTGTLRSVNPALLTQMRAVWDALNNGWNQWVLNYTQGRQLDLLRHLGFQSPSWTDLVVALGVVLALAALGGAGWMLWERRQHDPWLRLLQQARQQLSKRGLHSHASTPPRTLATQVLRHFGETSQSQNVHLWLLRLEALRYGQNSPDSLATLRREYRQIVWPTPPDT